MFGDNVGWEWGDDGSGTTDGCLVRGEVEKREDVEDEGARW
jgi:hypothetical protein